VGNRAPATRGGTGKTFAYLVPALLSGGIQGGTADRRPAHPASMNIFSGKQ